ncbi:hypothetical protein DSO57_1035186 [Entomophthora muscae]|uniref:Uncharacterized protein n=1 Tax=Entomophthora muscae TaxID=34485 RepID=A0ACC2TM30_9FUNG|nr:hypothetical protein DSO57_1035186 [Entomophthora muscae]
MQLLLLLTFSQLCWAVKPGGGMSMEVAYIASLKALSMTWLYRFRIPPALAFPFLSGLSGDADLFSVLSPCSCLPMVSSLSMTYAATYTLFTT